MTSIPRGIIFDLFHTLTRVESRRSQAPRSSAAPDTNRPRAAPDSAPAGVDRAAWTRALLELTRWRLCGEERDPMAIMRKVAFLVDPALSAEVIGAETRRRLEGFRNAVRDIPEENVRTLRALRAAGFRLALLSNADGLEIAAWNESPLSGLFDVEAFSCFVGYMKPDPEIYQLCLGRLGLQAPECWFVADGASNELVAARSSGITTVLMSGVVEGLWPDVIPERLKSADHLIRRIPELCPLLGVDQARGGDI